MSGLIVRDLVGLFDSAGALQGYIDPNGAEQPLAAPTLQAMVSGGWDYHCTELVGGGIDSCPGCIVGAAGPLCWEHRHHDGRRGRHARRWPG